MTAWWWFWTLAFIIAATSFFCIALIVLVRGIADLRAMIHYLAARDSEIERPPSPIVK